MQNKLTYKSVTYTNFMATGNKPVVIQLDASPTTLVYGKNGAGKSTMYEALFFGQYGKVFRKSNKPDLINNINNKNLRVEVDFVVAGSEFKVIRGIKPNIFEIYRNKKLIDQGSSVYDYQSHLEKNILKMSANTFRQIAILGSLHYVPYMRLKNKDRREIIEELLDIQVFGTMNVITKTRLAILKRSFEEADAKESLLERSINLVAGHIQELEANTVKLKKLAKNQLAVCELEKGAFREQLKVLQKEKVSIDLSSKSKLKESETKWMKYETLAKKELSDLDKDFKFFEENDDCNKCHQEIKPEFKELEMQEISARKQKISKALDNKIRPGSESTKKALASLSKLADRLIKINHEVVNLSDKITFTQKNIDQLQKTLDESIDKSSISTKRKELGNYKGQLTKLFKMRAGLRSEKEEYDFILELLKDDGIKKNIIKMYIPVINKLISKYLSILGFPIKFTFDEELKETIIVKGRRNLNYSSFSAGEKMRVDLALLFAFREIPIIRSGNSCNLLIFDEVADSAMDTNGWDSFLSIIDSISDVGNVFVISPRGDILVEKFTKSLKFKKEGSFSILDNKD